MSFKFEFKVTGGNPDTTSGTKPSEMAKEAIKSALRTLDKELQEIGVTITLEAEVGK